MTDSEILMESDDSNPYNVGRPGPVPAQHPQSHFFHPAQPGQQQYATNAPQYVAPQGYNTPFNYQQQPQKPFGEQFGAALLNPFTEQAGQMLFAPVMTQTQQTGQRWFHDLRYYFTVDNAYVWKKLRILFFPWSHKKWARARNPTMEYLPPTHDVNAPDLYLPTMGIVTYILLVGLFMGTQLKFTPDVIGMTATSALFTILVEVFFLKVALWLLNFDSLPLLDLVSYSGYKFINSIVTITLSLLAGNTGFWVSYSLNSIFMAFFLARSLKESIQSGSGPMKKTRNFFLAGWALCQILLTYFLCNFSSEAIPLAPSNNIPVAAQPTEAQLLIEPPTAQN